VTTSIDGEGDRVYIAPEILRGQYDKPADLFSFGLMIFEAACNVALPDNGTTWVELREGNLSHIPSLTSATAGSVVRDATGTPIGQDTAISPPATECIPFQFSGNAMTHDPSNLFGPRKRAELQSPPDFMANPQHPFSLDSIVGWMLHPSPRHRPTANQLLQTDSLRWVSTRRHAGATVYEGNWGPAEGPWSNYIAEGSIDTEMTDA
jgi:mitosis inhibitor protein kinase SWE1